MNAPLKKRVRCAVYTRKSTEEGLDQDYNSIDAQRDAGHAYIASQRAEGWIPVQDDYDDPAFSGGNMERPALKRLMADIEKGLVDVVVVYKVDRLSRSLSDFARMVDLFDRQGVSFVSVTQQFNTTSSMGRLTLNILLSFAQFEREVTGERIRDKIAASKAKGMWMGGVPPLGYDVVGRKLIVNPAEAKVVKRIFQRFLALGSTTELVKELKVDNVCAKSWTAQSGRQRVGKPIDKSLLYKLLNNPVYLGEIRHKDKTYPGAHEAVIDRKTWDDVQAILATNHRTRANQTRARSPALLRGIIFTADGRAMTPHHTKHRSGRLYRYYLSTRDNKEGFGASGVKMLPAGEVEGAVLSQLRGTLRSPEMAAMVWQEMLKLGEPMTAPQVAVALSRIDEIWDQLFPGEQARVVRLLVEKVTVTPNELHVKMRPNGVERMALEIGRQANAVEGVSA